MSYRTSQIIRLPRPARYLISGLLAALMYMFVAACCKKFIGLDLLASGIIGYIVAMPCAYLLHRNYSFHSRHPPAWEASKFIATSAASAILSGLIPHWLFSSGISMAFALAVTSIVVPSVNYLIAALWVFDRP